MTPAMATALQGRHGQVEAWLLLDLVDVGRYGQAEVWLLLDLVDVRRQPLM